MDSKKKSSNSKTKLGRPHPMPRKAGLGPSRGYGKGGSLKKKSV